MKVTSPWTLSMMLSLPGSWYSWFLLPWHESFKNTNDQKQAQPRTRQGLNSYHHPPSIHLKSASVTTSISTTPKARTVQHQRQALVDTARQQETHGPPLSTGEAYPTLTQAYPITHHLKSQTGADSHLVSCRSLATIDSIPSSTCSAYTTAARSISS